jgi:hypothetical protein
MTRHAAYSKYLLLPRENPEGLDTLLKGVRQDFEPRGTTEEEVVSEIAIILWRKRRVNRLLELELSDAELAREGEKSTKQHAGDVCRLAKSNDTNVNVQLTDVVTSLKGLLEGTASLGKLGANLRSFLAEIEELRPIMEMAVRSLNEAKKWIAPAI